MTAANDEPSGWKRAWSRIRAEFHGRFDNWWDSIGHFVGMAIFSAGAPKQLVLAFVSGASAWRSNTATAAAAISGCGLAVF